MRYLQSALLGLVAIGTVAVVVPAQVNQPPVPRNRAMRAPAMRMGRAVRAGLFRGITLSDAEKARVKAVREKYALQLDARRGSARPEMKELREARQRGDTAAVAAIRQKLAGQRQEARKSMGQANSEIRAALSPENQAKFDANAARVRDRISERRARAPRNGGGPPR
jgi:Spy/CpxP family protein refolding chaperone